MICPGSANNSWITTSQGLHPTEGDDFGVKFDVNVLYSGHARKNMSSEFAFLGGRLAASRATRARNNPETWPLASCRRHAGRDCGQLRQRRHLHHRG